MASANGPTNAHLNQPVFSFGVITDVQYADIPDGRSFIGIPRYYQHSLQVLQRAVIKWNSLKRLKFSINFGDIIDGHCPKHRSLAIMQKVLKESEKSEAPVYHMIGNYCLYNLPRDKLMPLLKIPSLNGCAYYDFSPTPEYRFVVLDAYDISGIGWPHDHPKTSAAMQLLQTKNLLRADDNNQLRISQISKHKEHPNNTRRRHKSQTHELTRFGLNAYVLGAIQWRD